MGRSFVTTGRMVMMRSMGYKWDEKKKKYSINTIYLLLLEQLGFGLISGYFKQTDWSNQFTVFPSVWCFFPFWMAFFYLVTTGWIFDISSCERIQSIYTTGETDRIWFHQHHQSSYWSLHTVVLQYCTYNTWYGKLPDPNPSLKPIHSHL